jgi:Restriction endonuclease NaeI
MTDTLFMGAPERGEDPELDAVEAELYRMDPTGDRVATVIRDTLDQLYDGANTGRYCFEQLHKTEKTHMGTLVEINLQREFEFADGDATDYRIAGVQIDCKYSMSAAWTLPPEVVGHLALLITASDERSTWRAGIVRVTEDLLNKGRNRDAKGTLSRLGRDRIRWLWQDRGRLAPNLFLQLDAKTRDRILGARAKHGTRHGQARVNELFRSVQNRLIRRAEILTVAQQLDPMKRVRGNGGARQHLAPEGIVILGHMGKEPETAERLGFPRPKSGEFIAVSAADVEALGTDADDLMPPSLEIGIDDA